MDTSEEPRRGRRDAVELEERRLWRRVGIEAVLAWILVGAALTAAILVLGNEIGHHIDALEGLVEDAGAWAIAVFVVAYVVLNSALVPDTVLGVIAGASLGFLRGLVAVSVGALIAAILQYALSRRLLRRAVERFLGPRPGLAAVQAAVRRKQLKLQLLLRLTPLNRAVTSYLLGATGVRLDRFLLALPALLPSLCVEVYFGYAGKHLARMTVRPGHRVLLHDVLVVGGLAAAIAGMVWISHIARRAVEAAATQEAGASDSGVRREDGPREPSAGDAPPTARPATKPDSGGPG